MELQEFRFHLARNSRNVFFTKNYIFNFIKICKCFLTLLHTECFSALSNYRAVTGDFGQGIVMVLGNVLSNS